jgi:hypothetical protein
MTPHPRHQSVAQASADIVASLVALQRDHGLTDAEMLLAVFAWERGKAGDMLRAERHPDDPDKAGDEE